jgi:hypothetical protein
MGIYYDSLYAWHSLQGKDGFAGTVAVAIEMVAFKT